MRMTMWGAGLAALTLAACSSGGGDESDGGPSFNELADEFDGLAAQYGLGQDVLNEPYVDASQLPTSGSAQYDGVMVVGVYDNPDATAPVFEALGETEIAVNFASADPISGGAGNFRTLDNREVGGSLDFSNGFIDRQADPATEYSLYFDVDGTLSSSGVNYALTGASEGDFLGDVAPGEIPDDLYSYGEGAATYAGQSGVFYSTIVADR